MPTFTTINEPIAVVGSYSQAFFTPKKFRWQGRTYRVERITFVSDHRDGGVRQRTYSVLSQGTLYRLEFNRDSEAWRLAEVWCE